MQIAESDTAVYINNFYGALHNITIENNQIINNKAGIATNCNVSSPQHYNFESLKISLPTYSSHDNALQITSLL